MSRVPTTDQSTGRIKRFKLAGHRTRASTLILVGASTPLGISSFGLSPVHHHVAIAAALLTTDLVGSPTNGLQDSPRYEDLVIYSDYPEHRSASRMRVHTLGLNDGRLKRAALACISAYLTSPTVAEDYLGAIGRDDPAWPFIFKVCMATRSLDSPSRALMRSYIKLHVDCLPSGLRLMVSEAGSRFRRIASGPARDRSAAPSPPSLAPILESDGETLCEVSSPEDLDSGDEGELREC